MVSDTRERPVLQDKTKENIKLLLQQDVSYEIFQEVKPARKSWFYFVCYNIEHKQIIYGTIN
jgi:hypothetical protein